MKNDWSRKKSKRKGGSWRANHDYPSGAQMQENPPQCCKKRESRRKCCCTAVAQVITWAWEISKQRKDKVNGGACGGKCWS